MIDIFNSDCLLHMKKMEENIVDFIVTDPPYGLKFMGKKWDHGIPGVEFWEEMLRICKPGSMLAAFGGTRTYHRLTCAIEDAGWEIRDCVMWLYGSGFPKSHNKFGLEGYGTALKPAYEPIILAMKPLDGTYAQNFEKWGLGGINIDVSRISTNETWKQNCHDIRSNALMGKKGRLDRVSQSHEKGRWPANLILDKESAKVLDEQCKGTSRFFYCAKASSSERNAGLEGMPLKENMRVNAPRENEDAKNANKMANFHPTVKPLSLKRYIIKLLAPPGDPLLLDPFAGSGSTLCAAAQLGIRSIGIEKEQEYCEIASKRIEYYRRFPPL